MSQVEDLLNSLTEDELEARAADMAEEPHIVINNTRYITVPEALRRIGVQYDHNVETVVFDCPRFWDGHDLSRMKIYINYMAPNRSTGCYIADEVLIDEVDETLMHFQWTISRNVTEYKGKVNFLVCIKKTDEDGNESIHWNSELNNEMYISEGLECMESIEQRYPDIYTQLLYRMDEYEAIGKQYMDTTISYAVGTNDEFREGDSTDNAKYYSEKAKSYSTGTENTFRENDTTDNAMYYSEASRSYAIGTGDEFRENDSTDNAMYYSEESAKSAENAATSETNAKASEDSAKVLVDTAYDYLERGVLVGPPGPQGPQGEQGPQGIQGIQGEKGDTGESGIVTTVAGSYILAVDEEGNLCIYSEEGTDIPTLEYDEETGNLYQIMETGEEATE